MLTSFVLIFFVLQHLSNPPFNVLPFTPRSLRFPLAFPPSSLFPFSFLVDEPASLPSSHGVLGLLPFFNGTRWGFTGGAVGVCDTGEDKGVGFEVGGGAGVGGGEGVGWMMSDGGGEREREICVFGTIVVFSFGRGLTLVFG